MGLSDAILFQITAAKSNALCFWLIKVEAVFCDIVICSINKRL